MTGRTHNFLLPIAALLAAAAASAKEIDWRKDPVRQTAPELADRQPAQTIQRMAGVPISSDNLPHQHAKSCLNPSTEFIIEGGKVFAEYSCCKPAQDAPDCHRLRYAFPSQPDRGWLRGSPGLRYDAANQAILWGDEIVATHGDPSDHGPYWRFAMAEGFALKINVVAMRLDGRAMADWVMVGVRRTSQPPARDSSGQPSYLNRCGR